MLKGQTIAFVGGGNMARSIVSGLNGEHYASQHIWVSGRNKSKLVMFNEFRVHTTTNNCEAVANADVVVLCVKPAQLQGLSQEISSLIIEKNPLLISVAAGINLPQLEKLFTANLSILRAMPNTPCALGAGVIGLVANNKVTHAQKEFAESLFRVTGITCWLTTDDELNKITILAGSGPAFVFLFMEALQAAAIEAGLTKAESELITKQMVLGAARMALETEKSVLELMQDVTSKGGTTETVISKLQESGFENIIAEAFKAGLARARFIESQLSAEI